MQGRDGDYDLAAGTAREELEAADASVAARLPRFPAGPLAVARGRCDQRAKRRTEAGRKPDPFPSPTASWPGPSCQFRGLLDTLLPSGHSTAACAWLRELDEESDRKAPGRLMVFWWRIGRGHPYVAKKSSNCLKSAYI